MKRRPARSIRRRRQKSVTATPIMVFLLVASFGILFAGCSSSVSITGPTKDELTDVSFTENDIQKFRELASTSSSMSSAEATGVPLITPPTVILSAASGTTLPSDEAVSADIDLSMASTYKVLRQNPATAGENLYVVNNTIVNVREAPSSSSKLLRTLDQGNTLKVLNWENGEWAKVEIPGGTTGFVTIRYIAKPVTKEDLPAKQKFFENKYYVSFQFVNLRKEPTQSSEKIGEIPGKTILTVLAQQGGFAKVEFNGQTGFVSLDYLTKFAPAFIVQQGAYTIPVLRYTMVDDASLQLLVSHLTVLKAKGVRMLSFKQLRQMMLDQDKKGTLIEGKNVLIAISGLTAENVRKVSDALTSNGFNATLFLTTKDVGISGITQKTLLTLIANGLDVQSGGHTGDDLRALTNAQVKLEAIQSRKILEDLTGKPVFAMLYPQGGGNERVETILSDAAYLFGVGTSSAKSFTRADLLRLPSVSIGSATTADEVMKLFP
jgi:uncharacterized protein YgiM (DUF1202 family)